MGIAQDIAPVGSIFDPGDQSTIAGQGNAILSSTGANSPLYKSGDFGQAGQAIVDHGTYLQHHNVGEDFGQMEDNQAALTALGQHFATLYQTGGPAAVAAAAAAQANTANSGGGLGGLKTMAAQSAENTGKVGEVAQAERNSFGTGATNANAASAASKLQQTLIQSALNHANRSKDISATAIKAQEAIDQQNINNQIANAANAAQHDVRQGGIQNAADQANLGISAAQAALTGGAAALSAGYNAYTANPGIDPTTNMTGNAGNLNGSGESIADLGQNQPDAANIPTDQLENYAAMTPYGAAVATPEDAWYNYLTTDPAASNNAAYASYQGASQG